MPAPRGLVQWLDQELHKSALLPRGAKLLVAVSGGADSVALLRLLLEINRSDYWKWQLVVGHVDHGIRGEAGAADARWVNALASQLQLQSDVRALHLNADCNEALARTRRYQALGEMVAAHACAGVVLAHHADDQAETVLMRIFRGCGVEGLVGMREEVKMGPGHCLTIWRPLLRLRRAQIRAYLQELAQPWRDDASNQSAQYLRNRVRAEVLPVIENIWPAAVAALGRLSSIAGDANEVLASAEKLLWSDARRSESGAAPIEFSRAILRQSFPALIARILRGCIVILKGSSETADFERISEALRLIQGSEGGKEIQLGQGVVVELAGGVVRVMADANDAKGISEGSD